MVDERNNEKKEKMKNFKNEMCKLKNEKVLEGNEKKGKKMAERKR